MHFYTIITSVISNSVWKTPYLNYSHAFGHGGAGEGVGRLGSEMRQELFFLLHSHRTPKESESLS